MASRRRRGGKQEESIPLETTVTVDPNATQAIEALADTLVSAINKKLGDIGKDIGGKGGRGDPVRDVYASIARLSRTRDAFPKDVERFHSQLRRQQRDTREDLRTERQRDHEQRRTQLAEMNTLRDVRPRQSHERSMERISARESAQRNVLADRYVVEETKRATVEARAAAQAESQKNLKEMQARKIAAAESLQASRAAMREASRAAAERHRSFGALARTSPSAAAAAATTDNERMLASAYETRHAKSVAKDRIKNLIRTDPEAISKMSDAEISAAGHDPDSLRKLAAEKMKGGRSVNNAMRLFAARQIIGGVATFGQGALAGSYSGMLGGAGTSAGGAAGYLVGGGLGALGRAMGKGFGSIGGPMSSLVVGQAVGAIGGFLGGGVDALTGYGQEGIGLEGALREYAQNTNLGLPGSLRAILAGGSGKDISDLSDLLSGDSARILTGLGVGKGQMFQAALGMHQRVGRRIDTGGTGASRLGAGTVASAVLRLPPEAIGALLAPGSGNDRRTEVADPLNAINRSAANLFGSSYTAETRSAMFRTIAGYAAEAQTGGMPFDLQAFLRNADLRSGLGMSGFRQAVGATDYARQLAASGPQNAADAYAMLYGTGLGQKGRIGAVDVLAAQAQLENGGLDLGNLRNKFLGKNPNFSQALVFSMLYQDKLGGGSGVLPFINPGMTPNSNLVLDLESEGTLFGTDVGAKTAATGTKQFDLGLEATGLAGETNFLIRDLLGKFSTLLPLLESIAKRWSGG